MVCDTPLKTRKNTDIDHLATVCITDIRMKSKSKAFIKEIILTRILEDAIKQCVPKKVSIRNDKSSLTVHENWVSQETKTLPKIR